MKKMLILVTVMLSVFSLNSYTLILSEDFNTALNWTSTGTNLWVRAVPPPDLSDGTAYANLPPWTATNNLRNGYLTSQVFNASGYSNLKMTFSHRFVADGPGTTVYAEYSLDGTNWTAIYTQTASIGAWGTPDVRTVSIPASGSAMYVRFNGLLRGKTTSQWSVDNVIIYDDPPTPPVPTLLSPSNNAFLTDFTPTFDWNDDSGATSYTILVDNNSDYSSPEINQSPTVSTYTPGTDLAAGTYYWKVLATNAEGSSAYSASWTVSLGYVPVAPTGSFAPGDGNTTTDTTPFFDWDDVAGAISYIIYIDSNSDISSPEVTGTPSASEYTSSDLPPGTYYWTVIAVNEFGESIGSTVISFTIELAAPFNITIVNSGSDVIVSWDAVPYATSYNVYTSADPYGTFVYTANVPSNSYTVPAATVRLFYKITASN